MKKLVLFILLIPTICWALQDSVIRPTNTTASRIVATGADKKLVSISDLTAWIGGTADRIDVSDDGDGTITITIPDTYLSGTILGTTDEIDITDNLDGTITISLPGSIKLDSATASRILATDGSKLTVSVDDLTNWIAGTANEIEVANDGDGTVTIGIVTSPTLDGTNFTGIPDGALDETYWLLAGRSGGQIAYGGTATGEDITLYTNTSKDGTLFLGDSSAYLESTVQLGIGTTAPSSYSQFETKLNVKGTGNSTPTRTAIAVENTGFNSAAAFAAINNLSYGFVGQMNGSNYASGTLPNYGYFYTFGSGVSVTPMVFATDGHKSTGGTSWIGFGPGGYNTSNISVRFWADKNVSIGYSTSTAQLGVSSSAATKITNILYGAAAQTANIWEIRDSSNNLHISAGLPGSTSNYFYGNQQTGDYDFIWAGDTEANLLRVDAGADDVRQGDWDTNYIVTDKTGDTWWVGSTAGLPFAEIYAYEASDTIAIAASGIANKVQVTTFNANGVSNNATPDHTTDDITIVKAGIYRVSLTANVDSADATPATFGIAVYKNNGATILSNMHVHVDFAGGGGELDSVSATGLGDFAASDTIEVWVWNYTGTEDIIFDDINLNLTQIGGT